ncbi:MAG: DNA polymerase I [Epsilonproteobacteria bacterium]|nr:DNA polymerase I [Campylobacterota bacterium]
MHRIKKDALFVVDGSYLLYRSFYAIKPLYTSKGLPTNAIYGFARAIKKMLDRFQPQNIVVAWDAKGKLQRSEVYAEYKQTRQKPPSDLFEQKDYIIQMLDLIGMCQIAEPGYEADDIIATLVKEYKDTQVVLACPDKDVYQLLFQNVLIWDVFKDRIINADDFKQEKSFGFEKVPFYYALVGDSSDNIPGVRGIGPKAATEIVQQFDSLDDLYKNLDKIDKPRRRQLLEENKDNAYLSHELFTLVSVPIKVKKSDFTFDRNAWAKARDFFVEFEFASLVRDVDREFGAPTQSLQQAGQEQQTLFDQSHDQLKAKKWKCIIVQTMEGLDELCATLKESPWCAVDTETNGPDALQDDLVGFCFAVNKKEAYYVPVAHKQGQQLDLKVVTNRLKPILESKSSKLVMQNAKFDHLVLARHGFSLRPVAFDTILAANLVRNAWQKVGLKDLSAFFLKEPMQKYKDVVGKAKSIADISIEHAALYGAHDALQTFKLKSVLEKELGKDSKLKSIFTTIEMPLYMVLTKMEQHGIMLDTQKLAVVSKEVDAELEKIESKIFAALEEHDKKPIAVNLKSPKQLEHLLFNVLGLPIVKKSSKGSRSTDQEVLQVLAKQHPIPGMILTHRALTKLKNTYLGPLPSFINPQTGRIHTSYSQTQVATGRLSSNNPNLQNIPASEGYGIKVRSAFVPPEGCVFLSADYSQIELRVLAHLSKDPLLIETFKEDQDIHRAIAAQLFDVSVDKVTHEQRQIGKRINFSIMYGMTPYGLSKDLGISMSEAKDCIDRYFEQYAKVGEWMERVVDKAKELGYTQTWKGRRRYIPELAEQNKTLFEAGKRVAINTPVQGTQAEIIKCAMIEIDRVFEQHKLASKMILQIHDELVFEVKNNEYEQVEKVVRQVMEGIVDWEVALKVTIRKGKSWGDVTK